MSCLHGKSKAVKDSAKYECTRCGALVNSKNKVCKAKKIK